MKMSENNSYLNRIKELHKAGEVNLEKYPISRVCDSFGKSDLLEQAINLYENGNRDLAISTIYRLLSMIGYLQKNKNLINWEKIKIKIGKEYTIALPLAEKWHSEVKHSLSDNHNVNNKTDIEIMKDTATLKKDTYLTCAWLHSKLVDARSNVLIIDTRSRADFLESHIKWEGINIVNIPGDDIKEGVSAAAMGHKLQGPDLDLYEKRNEFDYVIILHKEPGARANGTLYNALSKYDQKQYKNLIILTEGYIDWCNFYPHRVSGVVPIEENINVNEKYNLDNVNYDTNLDLDNEHADIDRFFKSRDKPQFDRSKKPIENRESIKNDIYAAKDEDESKIKAAKKYEDWNLAKEREIEAERCQIIEIENLKLEREAKEKYEKNLKEESAREELERRRKLKNAIGEKDSTSSSPHNNGPSGSDKPIMPHSVPYSSSQAEIPRFDRGIKPRKPYLKPIIGESPGLTGLKNLGNTCYMNSILQCISNNSSLVRYFLLSYFYNDLNRNQQYRGEIAEKVADVVKALWAGKHRAVACYPLKSAIGFIKPEYKTCEQQDSHEFLTYLMDWLHCDLKKDVPFTIRNDEKSEIEKVWNDFKMKNESVIFALFYGLQRSTVECLKCAEKSSTYEPFSNLSLIIPEEDIVSLSDCLKLYLKGEHISGWRCPKCNVERQAKKTVDLCKLPNILVIHLKRFSFLEVSSRKRTTFVDFPLEDLHLENNEGISRSYELFGVSNHYGTIEGGHYTAYCKNPQYNRWYKFDDHEVLDLSPTNVTTNAAYILFYSSPDKNQFGS